jgi:hypothetical protein
MLFLGVDEEVARDHDISQSPFNDIQIDDHELAARGLVFPMHRLVPFRDSPALIGM